MERTALTSEKKPPIEGNSQQHIDSQNDHLSPSQMYDFFIENLTYDPKTNTQRDRVSIKDLHEFVATTPQEKVAVAQLRQNFAAIKNMSYDEWGVETVITTKDMSELAKRGLPNSTQRVGEAPTWRSLNEAVRADPDYFPNKAKAARLQSLFEQNRELIDINRDNEISARELRLFEQNATLDTGSKYMAKILRDNFKTLSQDSQSIRSRTLSTLEMQLDPQSTEIDGILRGLHGAAYLVPGMALVSLPLFAGIYEGAKKLFPEIAPKLTSLPIRGSFAVGLLSGVSVLVLSELASFDRYKNQHAKLMPMFSGIKFER